MSDRGRHSGSDQVLAAIELSPLTDDETGLLAFYRDMSERDRSYILKVAEALSATSG